MELVEKWRGVRMEGGGQRMRRRGRRRRPREEFRKGRGHKAGGNKPAATGRN